MWGLKQEAAALSRNTGLRASACEKWMRYAGISAVTDLMRRYPDKDHAAATAAAAREIEDFILGATEPTEAGNQYVIPGCERDLSRGPEQMDLF